jgi:hypothetical protein
VFDAVLAADPVKHHLPALAEPIGELFAIVRDGAGSAAGLGIVVTGRLLSVLGDD